MRRPGEHSKFRALEELRCHIVDLGETCIRDSCIRKC
jgi:hypothetical protein